MSMDTKLSVGTLRRATSEDDIDPGIYVITRKGREPFDFTKVKKRISALIRKEPKIPKVSSDALALLVFTQIKSDMHTNDIDLYSANVAMSLIIDEPNYEKLAARILVDNHHKNTLDNFTDKVNLLSKIDGKQYLSEAFVKFVNKHSSRLEEIINYECDFYFSYFGFETYKKTYSIHLNGAPVERPQDTMLRVAIALHLYQSADAFEPGCNMANNQTHADSSNVQAANNQTHVPLCRFEESDDDILKNIEELYSYLSKLVYTHATPTYFNAGLVRQQLASCFLLDIEDNLESIMGVASECANISKWGGGVGISLSNLRSKGSHINGTNGASNGIIPFLRIYESVSCAFNQGGKRPGSFAGYLQMHHPDLIDFLKASWFDGNDKERARDMFYALWIPDLFMERLKAKGKWSFFSSTARYNLAKYHGDEYKAKYLEMEADHLYTKQMDASEIMQYIFKTQQLRGLPYICFSDAFNRHSMQRNLGLINSSNLCTEIGLHTSETITAVCNLASVNLTSCVIDCYTADELQQTELSRRPLCHEFPIHPKFDFNKLADICKLVVKSVNKMIDCSVTPDAKTRAGNIQQRPIAIGVQGLHNAYMKLRYPFDSKEAELLNRQIAEYIYYVAVSTSTLICRKLYNKLTSRLKKGPVDCVINGKPTRFEPADLKDESKIYPSMFAYEGYHANDAAGRKASPYTDGKLHFDTFGLGPQDFTCDLDWDTVREHIKKYGIYNSVLIGRMPTATTSQYLNNVESFEPITSNIYKRKTLAGEFTIINRYLVNDLKRIATWNANIAKCILKNGGSIQNINGIPKNIKALYKTAYEIDTKCLIKQAADAQPFVDQASSLNWFVSKPDINHFTMCMGIAWKLGLKTGKYYLRSSAAFDREDFGIDVEFDASNGVQCNTDIELGTNTTADPIDCILCSS